MTVASFILFKSFLLITTASFLVFFSVLARIARSSSWLMTPTPALLFVLLPPNKASSTFFPDL
jgi:hypothetical protein